MVRLSDYVSLSIMQNYSHTGLIRFLAVWSIETEALSSVLNTGCLSDSGARATIVNRVSKTGHIIYAWCIWSYTLRMDFFRLIFQKGDLDE